MSRGNHWEEEEVRVTSEVARRAIRRLNIFEWVVLGLAIALAVGGGALVAWVAVGPSGPVFRVVWAVTSLLLFIVPGIIVLVRHKREDRREAEASRDLGTDEEDD